MNPTKHETFGTFQIPLMQELIRMHPIYGSKGQNDAAQLIHRTLKDNGWDFCAIDTYTAADVVNEPDYVPVSEFGNGYQFDLDRPKHNVYGVVDSGADGLTVILNGHYDIDIVSDPQLWSAPDAWKSGDITDGKIFGRGATDMLGGLTSLISVGSYFAENKDEWRGKIILCAVTDEEVGGNGTVRSFKAMEKLGYLASSNLVGLVAEPTSGVVADESLGFMHMLLTTKRKSQHMGFARREHNSLYDMLDTITQFDEVINAAEARINGKSTGRIIHNFGIIRGGQDAAIPIGETRAEATIFYPVNVALEGFKSALTHELNHRSAGVVEAKFSDFGFRGHKSLERNLVDFLISTRESANVRKGIFKSPCDARIFSTYGVDDIAIYGPGMLEDAHSVDEHIELSALGEYNHHLAMAMARLLKK